MVDPVASGITKVAGAPRPPDAEESEYGDDLYCYIDGERYLVGRVRTLYPHAGDSNCAFETRMHRVAQRLYLARVVVSVSMTFKRRGGAYTECLVHMVFPPRPAPIEPDPRPAGGRYGEARGARGGGRRAA